MTGRGPRGAPRKLTARSLENVALFHLKRYACSVEGLRRVLRRKIARRLRAHPADPAEAARWLEELLARLIRAGYLDDARFAAASAAALHRQGASTRLITRKLREKGVPAGLVATAVRGLEVEAGAADQSAAVAYARRRRLGPFRQAALDGPKARARELAALVRRGFGFGLARRIVDASDAADLLSN